MSKSNDEGFSLVEVVIAMFLLAVLSLAVLPLIIGATRVSVSNKDLVAATSFASARLADLRDDYPLAPALPTSCALLQLREVGLLAAITDPAPTGMRATIDVTDPCPGAATAYPASIGVTIFVRDRTGNLLVTMPTLIRVSAP